MIFNILLLTFYVNKVVGELQLVSVQSIFRHGDRAPSEPYPNNPHGIEHWPNGWSQLTKVGAAQTQDLGQYYRRRYVDQLGLLNPRDLLTEVQMRSTSKKRAIQSGDNVMLGLMGTQIEQTNMGIHHNYKQDLLLKPNSVDCPKYDQILAIDNDRLFSHYNSTYDQVFRRISESTGITVDMFNVDQVFDSLYREASHGLALPQWALETVYDVINRRFTTVYDLVVELKRVQRLGEFNSMEKSKLRTGYLLGQIVEFMKNSTKGVEKPKLMLYSSHDATLTSLLYSMNASDETLTPYAAAITFELWKDPEGPHQPTYYVKALYRNKSYVDDAIPLNLPGCTPEICEFNQFLSLVEKSTVRSRQEHQELCKV